MEKDLFRTVRIEPRGHDFGRRTEAELLEIPGREPVIMDALQCWMCDVYDHGILEGDVLTPKEPCPIPEGITTRIEIEIPSGKMLITDDLRPIYDPEYDRSQKSYNSVLGQAEVIEAYAAQGCAYGPVGNTSPYLLRTGSDTFVIASPAWDTEFPPGEIAAQITTDLWAYSIADYENWQERGGNPGQLGWTETILPVPPGRYRFTHHTGEKGFDRDSERGALFAHIERVR